MPPPPPRCRRCFAAYLPLQPARRHYAACAATLTTGALLRLLRAAALPFYGAAHHMLPFYTMP